MKGRTLGLGTFLALEINLKALNSHTLFSIPSGDFHYSEAYLDARVVSFLYTLLQTLLVSLLTHLLSRLLERLFRWLWTRASNSRLV